MNGYPKIFNIESDPREEYNIAAMYEWAIGPALKVVEEYKAQPSALSEPSGSQHHTFLNRLYCPATKFGSSWHIASRMADDDFFRSRG